MVKSRSPLLTSAPSGEVDLVEIAADARPDGDLVDRLEAADELVVLDDSRTTGLAAVTTGGSCCAQRLSGKSRPARSAGRTKTGRNADRHECGGIALFGMYPSGARLRGRLAQGAVQRNIGFACYRRHLKGGARIGLDELRGIKRSQRRTATSMSPSKASSDASTSKVSVVQETVGLKVSVRMRQSPRVKPPGGACSAVAAGSPSRMR